MAKKKGSKGGNPNPVQTPEFLAQKFGAAADVPEGVKLGKPVFVRLPIAIDEFVRAKRDRSAWLRRVIIEAAKKESDLEG